MLNITAAMLNEIAPGGNETIVQGLIPYLNKYLPQYGIDTLNRLKHFFGQAAEESANFRTLTEYASGAEYNGRADLGNTQPGDGPHFKGRGIFQLTGRSNYAAVGKKLGIDLINNPALAATPEVAVQTACIYWQTHNLSALADSFMSAYDTCVAITKKINGGTNGLSVRWQFTQKAATVLASVVTVVTPPPVAQTAPTTTVLAGNSNIVTPNTAPAVFPIPVIKQVQLPQATSNTAANLDYAHTQAPIVWVVEQAETFVKKFF